MAPLFLCSYCLYFIPKPILAQEKSGETDIIFQKPSLQNINYKAFQDQAWWLMPVILTLWEAKVGRSPEVGSSGPA